MHSSLRLIALTLAAALTCSVLFGCTDAQAPVSAGVVADDTITVQAPALPVPSVDLNAGFPPDQGAAVGGAGGRRSSTATAVALTGLGTVVRVESVAVTLGAPVVAGQEIARLDSAQLDANVAVSKASLATARAQVGVVQDGLDTVASNKDTLADKRVQINSAASQLVSTRIKVAAQLAQAKALLARVESMKPNAPPAGSAPLPPAGSLPPGAKPPTGLPDPAKLRAGIAKLEAALAKIDAGLAKVSAGRTQLSSASAKLDDARVQLKDLRALARVGVDAAEVGVGLAEYQRELAVVRSPADGTVVDVASVGDVVSPGAVLATVRPSGAPRVNTWLAPERLGDVSVGTRAEISADWLPASEGRGPLTGSVSRVGTRAEYPPTSFATDDIHMTRAVRVEIALSNTADLPALPPGAPVDVRFLGK